MSKPRKPVGRRKRSTAARLRSFWIVLVLLVVAAAFGGYFLAAWPGFQPKRVAVAGNHRVPAHVIALRAAIDRRANLWLQNIGAAAQRVATIPDIGTVTIERALPANVTIVVNERVPYARVRGKYTAVTVDHALRVLQSDPAESALPTFITDVRLPDAGRFIRDERVSALRSDYDRLSAAHVAIASVRYDRFGDLIATTARGVQLLLGDDQDLTRKIALIGPILSQTGGRPIAAIDLRAPATPVIVYRSPK